MEQEVQSSSRKGACDVCIHAPKGLLVCICVWFVWTSVSCLPKLGSVQYALNSDFEAPIAPVTLRMVHLLARICHIGSVRIQCFTLFTSEHLCVFRESGALVVW